MSPEVIGIYGILLMFVFMFMGMPIGFCMAVTGFLGQVVIFGWHGALAQLGMVPYASVAKFTFCVIPLFMLMGEFAYASGITEDSYSFAYKILGRIRGGLAMSTIGANAIFAACTGSSVAAAVTFAKVALPEMRKYNYHPGLATGAIAAGGTLGGLIPPSNPMILYSIFTGASIGKLFIAGVFPGLILAFFFMMVIYVITTIDPSKGPAGEGSDLKDIASHAIQLMPALVLMIAVLGGLWGGVFSPSEAGAMGAAMSAVILIMRRRGSGIKEIRRVLGSTAQSTGMIFTIVIGALIFGDFMTISNLPGLLVKFIDNYAFPPIVVIFVLMIIYVILGALMEELAIMLITIPIIMPSLTALGIDPVWFGILFMVNMSMGLIMPPVGFICFVLAGIIEDIPLYTIYKGILPFSAVMFVCILLIMAFPGIALWLPNLMIR
jgi:tripartite ATP-independent transporter DctM subunit